MSPLEIVIALLLAVVVIVRGAGALKLPPAIALLLGGVALSFVPALGKIELAPDVIFTLFLPPLLFVAAVRTSWRDFWRNVWPIGRLALGLVVITTLIVGWAAHWAIPGLPWAAAFTLGAIVSPTDAVAATSITKTLGVPRRIVTILEGESLVNDASGLVVYRLAVAATLTGTFSIWNAGGKFLLISGGGIAVGLAVGWAFVWALNRIDDSSVENTLSLVVPFATYVLADEFLGVSGVLAVVSAGFYFSRRMARISSSETRLQAVGFWNMLDFLFNNALFLLVGLQLRHIIGDLGALSLARASVYALTVSAALIGTRIIWSFAVALGPKLLGFRESADDPFASWKSVTVVAWTGMRGAVSLAGALALPFALGSGAPFPQRNLMIFITFFSILMTLVFQGLTLPFLIRALHLEDAGETEREEQSGRLELARAALQRVEQMQDEGAPARVTEHFAQIYRHRAQSLEAPQAAPNDVSLDKEQVELEIVRAQRQALARLRKNGDLHEDAVRRIQQDLDLEEQRLQNHQAG